MRPLPTRVDLELGFSIVHIVRFPSLWRYRNAFTANHDFPFLVIPCLLPGIFFCGDGRSLHLVPGSSPLFHDASLLVTLALESH